MKAMELLLLLLEHHKGDKNTQAVYLQSYISTFGPIPDEYGDKVRELLSAEVK